MQKTTTGFFTYWDYTAMIVYILGIAALGFYVTVKSKEKSTKDYLLGGKSLPWWAITISLFATLFSAISFTAIPEEAYKNGLRLWLLGLISIPLIPIALWMFMGFYYSLGAFTPYEYIEKRFSPPIRFLSSMLFLIQRGLYLAVVLFASAKAFEAAVGWNVVFTILLVGVLGTLYTTVGGMRAVVWTDVVQFFVLCGGIVLVAIVLACKVDGGVAGIISYAFEHERGFNIDESFFSFDVHERATLWWMCIGAFFTTLNYYATDQLVIQRLLSTKTYKEAKKTAFSNIPLSFSVGLIFWFIGLGLFAYYNKAGGGSFKELDGKTLAFPYFIATQLPPPVPGLIVAGLLAAIMSTVVCKDVYARFINPKCTEMQELKISKIMTAFWGVFMVSGALMFVAISERATSTIMETSALWASMGGLILAIYILGATSRHIGTKGIWIASGVGLIALIVGVVKLHYMTPANARISFILVGNIGTFVTLGVGGIIVLAARILKKPVERKKTDGLTLWSIDRAQLKNK